jgi:hypothetical protein
MAASALKKVAEARGVINRTHGGDTYDHHKMRKALRRVDRWAIQEQLDEEAAAVDLDAAREMDLYYQELGDQLDQDTWREMNAYEAETGMTFVCEGHYHQHMAYLEWKSYLS